MKKSVSKEVYYKEVLSIMPRILNLLNRNPSSKTYGSFDRDYWNYNAFDFSCARKQEAVLTLALVYQLNKEDNIYYKSPVIIEWINAVLIYWAKIQHNNGSFDEIYPNENAFNTTAFSGYCVSETLLLLKDEIRDKNEVIMAVKKAANFLLDKHETRVFNQEAGATIFLYNAYLLTGEKEYKLSAREKIGTILKNQTKEGWFREYRGADVGYLSLCIDYLSKYYEKTKDKNLLKALKKGVDFISYFVHPNNTFGGEYGSRNTEYMVPHGFEILAKHIPTAGAIAQAIRKAIEQKSSIVPSTIDDKYLLFNAYTYLQAYYDGSDFKDLTELPFAKIFTRFFEESGLYVFSDYNFYIVSNLRKGGSSKVIFKKNLKALDDAGLTVKSKNGIKYTSSWLNDKGTFDICKKGFNVWGRIWLFKDNILSPLKLIMLRGFQLTLGRSEWISLNVKNILRDKIISKSKKGNYKFRRELRIEENQLTIRDIMPIDPSVSELTISSKTSFIYGASSRYFQKSDLDSPCFRFNKKEIKGKEFRFVRVYNCQGNLVKKETY